MKNINLWISPCPNDTFIFHAMLHSLVDTEDLTYDVHFADIESLNKRAIQGQGDVIKASVAVAPQIPYTMLDSGAALGYGNGPIVVSAQPWSPNPNNETGNKVRVAIPGAHTTAALLFKRYFPQYDNLIQIPFHAIAQAVQNGEVELGVLIHEGRFTYKEHGLCHVADLGQMWENQTKLPIPLGAIFANNLLSAQVIKTVERTIARSTAYAFSNRDASATFVAQHARELAPEVLCNHIDFFVNDFTLSLGDRAQRAIAQLLQPIAQSK